jgi:hypothetical protein
VALSAGQKATLARSYVAGLPGCGVGPDAIVRYLDDRYGNATQRGTAIDDLVGELLSGAGCKAP